MEFFRVSIESHATGSTLYVAGVLAPRAAARFEDEIGVLPASTRVVRVDLRGVVVIDPAAFVRVARSLTHWRDARRGQVLIQFPEGSHGRRAVGPRSVYPSSTIGNAVSTATSWPMRTSPG
jgi:ABC-type transporter Mla MlaB component